MNTISKTHREFSRRLENPRVLTNPEEFLGPNYKEVLNFWLILDELSEEQLRVGNERYEDFYNNEFDECGIAEYEAYKASIETIEKKFELYATCAVWKYGDITFSITKELIGMHKILENHQQPLTFFQMILEVL